MSFATHTDTSLDLWADATRDEHDAAVMAEEHAAQAMADLTCLYCGASAATHGVCPQCADPYEDFDCEG